MTLAEQKRSFEAWLRMHGIAPTYTLDGDYSGAKVRELWEVWQQLEKLARA